MTAPVRLAIVATHPIQHFVPLYRALADERRINLRVFYASRMGLRSYFDMEMNRTITWKMDLLSGYDSQFLSPEPEHRSSNEESIPRHTIREGLTAFAPDAVIVYGYSTPLSRHSAAIARRMGASTLIIGDSELRQRRSPIKRALKACVIPILLSRFDAFLSVGDENERYYRRYGVPGNRVFRSPFPIDEAAFKAARTDRGAHRRTLFNRLEIAGDPFLALFVGKLSPRKRPDDLIEAVKLAADRTDRPVHAVFAGDGALFDRLRERAEACTGRVHQLGFVNVDILPEIYAGCDAIVHPSAADPHPLICSEAACMGLPMVISDRVGAEGPTDVARRGRNAMVYPVGDVGALASALAILTDDTAQVAAMGQASIEIFDELDIRRSVGGIIDALCFVGARVDD